MSGRNGGLFGALRRMVGTNAELESEDLRREAERAGADTVATCAGRQRVVLQGIIRTVTLPPRSEAPRMEAEFDDGSGTITLVWLGRREVPGILAGTVLRVAGRLSVQRGGFVLYNPKYELVQVPGVS